MKRKINIKKFNFSNWEPANRAQRLIAQALLEKTTPIFLNRLWRYDGAQEFEKYVFSRLEKNRFFETPQVLINSCYRSDWGVDFCTREFNALAVKTAQVIAQFYYDF